MVADPDPDRFVGFANAELVGAGGLGRVFQATRISTGGAVAIKELTASPGSPLEHRARRELEAMLRLKGHPNIVSVEEIFDGPNGPCLVMELLSGGTLSDRLATGSLDPVEIRLVVEHVTAALETAHAAQIVHRDIKPANLMYGRFGQVKVLDFGIAALVRDGEVTQTGAFTLAYASPEELDGDRRIGPAADVYSLSATLLHLMTGSPPSFRDRMAGRANLAHLDPRLSALGTVVEAGLRHSPGDRPSLSEFRRAVERIDSLAAAPTELIAAQATHGAASNTGVSHRNDARRPETRRTAGAPAAGAASTGGPSHARALAIGTAAFLILLGIAGIGWLLLADPSDTDESSSALDDPAASEAAPTSSGEASAATVTATTLTTATTDPPVPETVIVTVLIEPPPETNAPIPETVVVTVLVEATTSPPPEPTPAPPDPVVSEASASEFMGMYLRAADGGDFPAAWAMLSPSEQAGYSDGLDSFAEFWRSRVLLAGPASPQMGSLGVEGGVALFETVLWYDVCSVQTGQIERSTERVHIGLIAGEDGLLMESYDFVALVESPEIGVCP